MTNELNYSSSGYKEHNVVSVLSVHEQIRPSRRLKPDVARRVFYDTLISNKLGIR